MICLPEAQPAAQDSNHGPQISLFAQSEFNVVNRSTVYPTASSASQWTPAQPAFCCRSSLAIHAVRLSLELLRIGIPLHTSDGQPMSYGQYQRCCGRPAGQHLGAERLQVRMTPDRPHTGDMVLCVRGYLAVGRVTALVAVIKRLLTRSCCIDEKGLAVSLRACYLADLVGESPRL